MLQFPDADVETIGRYLSLPEARVHETLGELSRMSLVRASGADPGALCPVDPSLGLAALLARRRTEMAHRHQELEDGGAAFARFAALHTETRARPRPPDVEYVAGVEAIRGRVGELTGSCAAEMCSFRPAGVRSVAGRAASRKLDAGAVDRGVRLRTVYLDSVRNDQAALDHGRWLVHIGSEVRTVPALPLSMLVVDRTVAIVPGETRGGEISAVVLSTDAVIEALMALFRTTWQAAVPLGSTRHRDAAGLSAQEKQVLRFLGEGRTDESISRRLGVSVRTSRRLAADLLARLGARSRFQAGALALARQWIDASDLE